jgi:hypothetical protein
VHPEHPPSLLGLLFQDGETPLYVAVVRGHKEIVELLLGAGAAMDAANKVRLTTSNGWMRADGQGIAVVPMARMVVVRLQTRVVGG